MNQWAFVIGAYALVLLATLGLVIWAWQSMHRAEDDAEALKRRP